MDKLVAVLQIIAGAKSLVPGLGLIASIKTPESPMTPGGKVMAFVVDADDPRFQAALDVIGSWESSRPVQDHRPEK